MSGFWNNYIYYKKKELRKLQLFDISIERCEKFFFSFLHYFHSLQIVYYLKYSNSLSSSQ